MSWTPQLRFFINYIIFKIKNKKKGKEEDEQLQSALQPLLYSATILYNNNVPKIINIYIYIYIYIFFFFFFNGFSISDLGIWGLQGP